MKVTNYDNSKALAEIGFKPDDLFEYCYKKGEKDGVLNRAFEVSCRGEDLNNYYPAWDLETILEALPMDLDMFDGRFNLVMDRRSFFAYANFDKGTEILQIVKAQDESLADTAARLLILLESKNLVKFKEENGKS